MAPLSSSIKIDSIRFSFQYKPLNSQQNQNPFFLSSFPFQILQWNSFPLPSSPSTAKSLHRFEFLSLSPVFFLRSRMRFFLEFVSCCASPRHTSESLVPAEDEDRWLVPAPVVAVASVRRPNRKRKVGAPDWRPSLGSISEDVMVPQKCAVASAGREGKKKSGARGGAGRVYHRSYSEGYHRLVKKKP